MNYTLPVNSHLYNPRLYKPRMLQLPIVYRDEYNIYDNNNDNKNTVYKKIIEKLNLGNSVCLVPPNLPTNEDLGTVHSLDYLRLIRLSNRAFGNIYRQRLNSEKYQAAGSILAGKLAIYNGWSINIGGGFHTSTEKSCDKVDHYADITLLVYYLFASFPDRVSRVMIIDLDAGPGYGIKCDFADRQDVFILDVYNGRSFFSNLELNDRNWIKNIEIIAKEDDNEKNIDEYYLKAVKENLELSLNKFCPDVVVYVAGMNILKDKTNGGLSISKEGLFKRDEIVFEKVKRDRNIPIVTLMGHNYGNSYNEVFAESIINLRDKAFLNLVSLTQSHLKYYINCCLDEICTIEGQGFAKVVNDLCKSKTIEEARKHWIPSDFYFPDDNNRGKEISSFVLSRQANFERKTTSWEINDWSCKELKEIRVNIEHIDLVCLSESMSNVINVELIASMMYDNIPLYVEIVAECDSKWSPLSCNGTVIVSRNSRYFIQNLNHNIGEYCKNEIKTYVLSKEGKERRRKIRKTRKNENK